MRKARLLFVMILFALLTRGTGWASQSKQAPEQPALPSDETSLNKSSPDTQIHGPNEPTDKYSDENHRSFAARKDGTRQHRPAAGHAKPAPSRPLRSGKTSAANDLRTGTPRNVLDSHQTGSAKSPAIPNKLLPRRGMPVPPPTVALSGQHFKNSRDPGARMASSGGPASATRSPAALNGTNMKPKP
ncbi:MAG TPA: hypothetical protein VEK33_11650 [Terriglobales bacterium]|nr:hypothetical protein [Terriglobales bacterium]